MTPDKDAVRTYFAKLGFGDEIADIYLALHAHGPQNISELSRTSRIERTRIYRLIDQLMESGLIEVESGYARGILRAAPIANLRSLIEKRAVELKGLQDELHMVEQLLRPNLLALPGQQRVQLYAGTEGIKHMFWNLTKTAGNEVIMILHENMRLNPQSRFIERWTAVCNEKAQQFRVLLPASIEGSTDAEQPSSGIGQIFELNKAAGSSMDHWQPRYAASADAPGLTHGMAVYDDTVAYFTSHDTRDGVEEVYGLELVNKAVAGTQRHYFDLMWERAAS